MAALDPATPDGFDYYDINSIMSEEVSVPCVLRYGCTGVGRILDPGADLENLKSNTRLDLPLWMVGSMAKRQLLQAELPIFLKDHMRRKLRAGPGCENLRVRCPHFYTVAHKVHENMLATGHADETLPQFIQSTFVGRYRELLSKAPMLESNQEASDTKEKLTVEELRIFDDAAESAAAHNRYRANRESSNLWKRRTSIKRVKSIETTEIK